VLQQAQHAWVDRRCCAALAALRPTLVESFPQVVPLLLLLLLLQLLLLLLLLLLPQAALAAGPC
jgi:hypothetical protein